MTYDLAILGDPENTVPALTIDNTACEGIYKLIQKVMILLLTDVDGENNIGGVGTSIPAVVRGSNVPEPEVVSNLFAAALADIKPTLLAAVTPDTPTDEVPSSLKADVVTDADNLSDVVAVEVTVIAQSGQSTSVKIPVSSISTGE